MALGAQAGDVVGMIFRQGFLQLAIGMTIGLTVAFFMSRLVAMLLVDVKPHDPLVFGSVIGVLAAAGMLACFVPARRATRVDPLTALRAE
jgi:ABC-type antimicrobial peptide transport system permease subunit